MSNDTHTTIETDTGTRPTARHDAHLDDVGRSLLHAARSVLADEGPAALTVRRLAAAAGVSTMNVYSRFGGKDGVVDELFVDGFRRLTEMMRSSPLTDDPLADLRSCRASYRQFALENPTYYAVMFDKVFPEHRPSERAELVALEALNGLTSRVQRAIDAGLVVATNPWLVATGLWATCHGLVSLERRQIDVSTKVPNAPGDLVQASDWDVVYNETLDHLLAGYLADAAPGLRRLGLT